MEGWVDITDADGVVKLNIPKNTFFTYFEPCGYKIVEKTDTKKKVKEKINLKEIIKEDNDGGKREDESPVVNPENKDEKQDK